MTKSDSPTQWPAAVFNPQRLDRHIHASRERALAIFDIVGNYVAAGSAPIEQARCALIAAQLQQAAQIVHNLKASAGYFGGIKVCEIAEEFERQLTTPANTSMVDTLLNGLEAEFVVFLRAADEWLKVNRAAVLWPLTARAAQEQKLRELHRCLSSNNLHAVNLFHELHEVLQQQLATEPFAELRKAISELNFAQALSCLTPEKM